MIIQSILPPPPPYFLQPKLWINSYFNYLDFQAKISIPCISQTVFNIFSPNLGLNKLRVGVKPYPNALVGVQNSMVLRVKQIFLFHLHKNRSHLITLYNHYTRESKQCKGKGEGFGTFHVKKGFRFSWFYLNDCVGGRIRIGSTKEQKGLRVGIQCDCGVVLTFNQVQP